MDYTLPARLLCPRNSKGKNTGVDDLPDPGIEPTSPALAGRLFTTSATQEAQEALMYPQCESFVSYAHWQALL